MNGHWRATGNTTFAAQRNIVVWPNPRLRTHSQNRTVAARAMADRKTVGQRS